jgi:hypothetical protein
VLFIQSIFFLAQVTTACLRSTSTPLLKKYSITYFKRIWTALSFGPAASHFMCSTLSVVSETVEIFDLFIFNEAFARLQA